MVLIDLNTFSELTEKLNKEGFSAIQTDEGALLEGNWLYFNESRRFQRLFVFEEYYLNELPTVYRLRQYNKIPQRYQKIIDEQ